MRCERLGTACPGQVAESAPGLAIGGGTFHVCLHIIYSRNYHVLELHTTNSTAKLVALIGVEGPSTVMRHCGLYVLLLCLGLIGSL